MGPEFKILVIVAFFAWVLCSVFYSQVVRPVLRDCVRFKLFALRDDLRRMAVMGQIPAERKIVGMLQLEKQVARSQAATARTVR